MTQDTDSLDILLFDKDNKGHHLEYASRLVENLESEGPNANIDFLTGVETDLHGKYFESPVDSLFDTKQEYDLTTDQETLARAVEFANQHPYDVFHLLHADDILEEIKPELQDLRPGISVVATLGGAFFQEISLLELLEGVVGKNLPLSNSRFYERGLVFNNISRQICSLGLGNVYASFAPQKLVNHYPTGKDIHMYECLSTGIFDSVLVPNQLAASYLSDLNRKGKVLVETVHDPVDKWDGSESAKRSARKELDFSDETDLLLFFGGLREEKGVKFLLESLYEYSGMDFTLVIAGPPTDITSAELNEASRDLPIDVKWETDFILESRTRLYFQATDAVLLPYKWGYGRYRPSNVFHKAIGTGRPVVAADLGVMGEMTRRHRLGETFRPESHDGLRKSIDTLIREGFGSWGHIESVAEEITYKRLAEKVLRAYNNTVEPELDSRSK